MIFTVYGHGCHPCHVTRTNYINFCSLEAYMFYIKSDSNCTLGFWGEDIWNFDGHSILVTLSQGLWMTLTFDIHRGSYKTYFHFINYKCFGWMHCFTFFQFKHLRDHIWPCKIGQGQPRVIIYTTFVGLKSLLLSSKVIWITVLERKIFKGFLPYHPGSSFI